MASVVGALSGYVVLALVARNVTLEQNAVFVTFWSGLLVTYGVLTGVNTETARSVAQAGMAPKPPDSGTSGTNELRPRRSSVATVALITPILTGVVGLVAAALGIHVFGESYSVLAFVVALSATAYSVEAVMLGALSGRAAWGPYAGLLTTEALLRVVLVGTTALAAATVTTIAAAAAAAAAAWVIFLAFSSRTREALRSPLDEPVNRFLQKAGMAAVAAGASGVLLVGFPVMVSLTTPASIYATAAPLMLAITLTRAPIMVPLTAFQSVVVSHFVRQAEQAGRLMIKIIALLVAVGGLGGLAAWLIGPWLMTLLFGPDYQVPGGVLAVMTLASAGTAIITVTAALAQALKLHAVFVAGWLVALALTAGILLTSYSMTTRLLLALGIPPLIGAAVHLVAVLRHVTTNRANQAQGSAW